jgi:hypothetical protein
MVYEYVPSVVGTPPRIPAGVSVQPGGKAPATTDQVTVPVPPVLVICSENWTPRVVPDASTFDVMTSGSFTPVIVN